MSHDFINSMIRYDLIPKFIRRSVTDMAMVTGADRLETADEVLHYVRNLRDSRDRPNECLQFLILAAHTETIKKYPFLSEYLQKTNLLNYEFNRNALTWKRIIRDMNDQTSGFWKIGPCVAGLLFAVTGYCYSQINIPSSYRDLSIGNVAPALLGGLTLFGGGYCLSKTKQERDPLEGTLALKNLLSP